LPIAGVQQSLYTSSAMVACLFGELKELRRAVALEVWGDMSIIERC